MSAFFSRHMRQNKQPAVTRVPSARFDGAFHDPAILNKSDAFKPKALAMERSESNVVSTSPRSMHPILFLLKPLSSASISCEGIPRSRRRSRMTLPKAIAKGLLIPRGVRLPDISRLYYQKWRNYTTLPVWFFIDTLSCCRHPQYRLCS